MRKPKRGVAAVAACIAIVLCLGLVLQTTADNGTVVKTGPIVSAANYELVIRDDEDDEGKELTFVVHSSAVITLNGAKARLEDLKPGYYARVTGERSGDEAVALLVEAGAATAAVSQLQ